MKRNSQSAATSSNLKTTSGKVLKFDNVNHPKHYINHPSGIECIEVTRHFNFNLGNVIKYVWRAPLKNKIEDLKKAAWYLNDEIKRLELEGRE